MKALMNLMGAFPIVLCLSIFAQGQTNNEGADETAATLVCENSAHPIDGITKRSAPPLLGNDFINERDVLWEKRIWRELDLRERMNHHFSYQKEPLINILLKEAKEGSMTVYSNIDDQFTTELTVDELSCISGTYDTIAVYDPETYTEKFVVVHNEFNPEHVIRYRIKEVWYFDSKLSKMNVRILGIAPIMARFDESGKLIGEVPLFWVYYPDARERLTDYRVFSPHNDAQRLSWDDVFQIRYFASLIVKESNVHDRRIKDYKEGVQALYEAEDIHNSMFNYEQDMWER